MIGIPFLLYNKVIDADCKSAEHKRLGHFDAGLQIRQDA